MAFYRGRKVINSASLKSTKLQPFVHTPSISMPLHQWFKVIYNNTEQGFELNGPYGDYGLRLYGPEILDYTMIFDILGG